MVEVLQQHELYKLDDYKHARRTCWPQPVWLAFGRRMYLHEKIVEKAARLWQEGSFAEKKEAGDTELDKL